MCIQRHTFVIWRLTSLPVSLPISPALPYWTNVTSYRLLPPLSFLTYFSQICFFSYYVSYLVYIVTDHHFSHCSSQISYTCDRNHGVRLTWRSWSSITPSPFLSVFCFQRSGTPLISTLISSLFYNPVGSLLVLWQSSLFLNSNCIILNQVMPCTLIYILSYICFDLLKSVFSLLADCVFQKELFHTCLYSFHFRILKLRWFLVPA